MQAHQRTVLQLMSVFSRNEEKDIIRAFSYKSQLSRRKNLPALYEAIKVQKRFCCHEPKI